MFVSASTDLKLHSWSEESIESSLIQIPIVDSPITDISFCNDNTYMAFLRDHEKPQILATKPKQNMRIIHTMNIPDGSALTFKRNTKRNIAIGTKIGDCLLYDTKERQVSFVFPKASDRIKQLEFNCEDDQLYGITDEYFLVYSNENEGKLSRFKQQGLCTVLKCHSCVASKALVGFGHGSVALLDLSSISNPAFLDLMQCPITGAEISSTGEFLVVSGSDVHVCGIDTRAGRPSFQLQFDQEHEVSALALSPDDKFIAVGLEDGTVKLYDIRQRKKPIHAAHLHEKSVNKIIFENKCKGLPSAASSLIKLKDAEIKDEEDILMTLPLKQKRESREEVLSKVRKHLLKIIKSEMENLDNQFNEHCHKFQKFMENEFQTIDTIITKKWNVFKSGDTNEIIKAICLDESNVE